MPEFQFTPILTVVTNDDGILRDLQWDWSDSGQGQWNQVTTEHDPTSAHEQVCKALDSFSTRWVPEGEPEILRAEHRFHEPITPVLELVHTIEVIASTRQRQADEQAQRNNPQVDPARLTGHDSVAHLLRSVAEQIRLLCVPRVPEIDEPVPYRDASPDAPEEYRCDVRFPWLIDEDRLPRVEHGYGATPGEARAAAEEIGRLVVEDTTGEQ